MREALRVILVAACVAATTAGTAAVIHVPDDYPTIQEAVDVAAEGDTVLVGPGVHGGSGNRNIDFGGVNMVLRSEEGPEATTIDCGGFGRGFHFHSGESLSSVIEGFRIAHGSALYGGGLWCEAGSAVTIRDCIFYENSVSQGGGGIKCEGGSTIILDEVILEDNTALRGGGIIATGGSVLMMSNSSFISNTASLSGGLRCEASPTTLTNVLFEANLAYETVGGMACFDATYILTNVAFRANTATTGGGFGSGNATTTLDNCTFALNAATEGSAVHCGEGAVVAMTNAIVAQQMAGLTVFCDPASSFSITRSCIYANAGGDSLCGDRYDNMFQDPLFCDVWGGNLRLHLASSCLPDNNSWGELLGAFGGGCTGPVPVEASSWGSIKALYR